MEAILVILFSFLFFGAILVLLRHKRINETTTDNDKDLSEWNCPECGFLVQAGNSCTYCYTNKPSDSSIQS